MNRSLLTFAVLLLGSVLLVAQEPKLEDDSSPGSSGEAVAAKKAPSKAERWRSEILGWKDPFRVEAGAEAESVKELSRSVLILGTVKGDVSTVSGDVAVLGTVEGNVSTISGTVTVLGTVKGKVSVVGGDLRVAGNVLSGTSVLGGKLETAPKDEPEPPEDPSLPANPKQPAASNGKSTANGAFKFSMDGGNFQFHLDDGNFSWGGFSDDLSSFISAFWLSPFMLLWRGGLLVLWIALSGVLAALFQTSIQRTQAEVRQAPVRCAALGLLWSIVFWVLLLTCAILSLILIGLPLLFILIAFDLALGVFGRTVSFSIVGEWLAQRRGHRQTSVFTTVFIGACAVGLLRLIPIVGSALWFAASLFGIGATLATRFGQAATDVSDRASLPAISA